MDMDDVEDVYLSSDRTGFWVAEELAEDQFSDTKYEVEGEDGLELEDNYSGGGRLVGTVAVVIKEDPDMKEPPDSVAWLRRMAVGADFRRRGLGARLTDVALSHCRSSGFRAVELVTTEAHEAARCLYAKKGFEIVQNYQDHYLMGLVSVSMFRFRRSCGGREED